MFGLSKIYGIMYNWYTYIIKYGEVLPYFMRCLLVNSFTNKVTEPCLDAIDSLKHTECVCKWKYRQSQHLVAIYNDWNVCVYERV